MINAVESRYVIARDTRFYLILAFLMTMAVVSGFSVQLALGRSTFAAPPIVHAHAVLFFSWTALFVVQNVLVSTGAISLHRRLGWLALGLVPAMMAMGIIVTVLMVRAGRAPFFFTPLYFLFMNTLGVLVFAGLTLAAIRLRRQTEWHRRLMICGMATLTAPAIGRLLPAPLLIPWAGWAVFLTLLLFPLVGVIRDWRRSGQVHPAWIWGMGTMATAQIMMDILANSPVGLAFYDAIVSGSPGAGIDARSYPPFPGL